MATTPKPSKAETFPNYKDGDVLLVLSQTRHYQLHSRTLRMHSKFFKDMLTDEKAAQLNSKARKEGNCVRYRLELELNSDDEQGVGQFAMRVSILRHPQLYCFQMKTTSSTRQTR